MTCSLLDASVDSSAIIAKYLASLIDEAISRMIDSAIVRNISSGFVEKCTCPVSLPKGHE